MPNRTICSVLEEMRKSFKTYNFAGIPGLIEEAQTMANRMEAGLWDQNDYEHLRKITKKLEKRRKKLEDEVDKLEQKKEKL